MKTKIDSKKLLKRLIDVLWYGGISGSIILIVAVGLYNLSVIGLINIKMPAVSINMGNYGYRFNTQYGEVIRINSIIAEAVEKETATALFWSISVHKDAIEQLYGLDFSKQPADLLHSEVMRYGRFAFFPQYLIPVRYFEHRLMSEPIIGFSFLLVFVSMLLIIILNNLKKIFNNYVASGTFSTENSELLKYIGLYFLIGEFVRLLIFYWINNAVARTEWVNSIRQSYDFSFGDINFALIFAGVIFLILAQIFRVGAVLKQENDLTV